MNLNDSKCENINRIQGCFFRFGCSFPHGGIEVGKPASLTPMITNQENAMKRNLIPRRSVLLCSLICLVLFAMVSNAQDSLAELKRRQARVKAAVKKVMPATVSITDGVGFGSGVVVSRDGYILTAGHVLTTNPEDRDLTIYFSDGSSAKAKPLGKNLDNDAGMAKLIGDQDWPYVDMGDSKKVKRGDWCICIGHSGGYELGRTPPVRTGKILRNNNLRIMTDCALIGGDSGGPLFDLDGKLIGIHSSIGSSLAENRHSAINPFLADWDDLAAGKTWGRLGTERRTALLGIVMERDSARIEKVLEDSAAEEAGIEVGDLIIRIDNDEIASAKELQEFIADQSPGNRIKLTILRNNRTLTLTARLKSAASTN